MVRDFNQILRAHQLGTLAVVVVVAQKQALVAPVDWVAAAVVAQAMVVTELLEL